MKNLTELEKIEIMAKTLIKIMQLPSYREDEAHAMAFDALKSCGFMDNDSGNDKQ